ncbi:type I-B CRISPR-associated protein Cas5b [Halegenticoccus tardaugens]|uniref:type I-B CRISPR-associated protein Cas5b n=1 Tax=Halegenticoccus tardaugens TaxID=2071624 RepID=UPI00100AB512|nr:type I-B CRISPR-associated protein Cas5b [Halegenticoccus tardaugens]
MTDLPARELPDDEAVSLTVSGRWAHFRNIEGTLYRTYTMFPRTTVAGFLAAIVGRGRDTYYDVFHPNRTRVSVTLDDYEGTHTMSRLYLGTRNSSDEKELTLSETGDPAAKALTEAVGGLPNANAIYGSRQRPVIHMIRRPTYTIDVVFDRTDERTAAFREELVDHLSNGTSVFTPYLGTAECLARIEFNGEVHVKSVTDDAPEVESALPLSVVNPIESGPFTVEKHPYNMTRVANGRRLNGTVSVGFSTDEPLIATEACGFDAGNRKVAFY